MSTLKRVIQADEWGVWVDAYNWVARPKGPTQFKAGEKVKSRHVSGSMRAVVSSLDGSVKEEWTTLSILTQDLVGGTVSKEEMEACYREYVLGERPRKTPPVDVPAAIMVLSLTAEQLEALQRAQYRNGEPLQHTLLQLAGLVPEPQRGAPVKDSMADDILRAEDERILRSVEGGG